MKLKYSLSGEVLKENPKEMEFIEVADEAVAADPPSPILFALGSTTGII